MKSRTTLDTLMKISLSRDQEPHTCNLKKKNWNFKKYTYSVVTLASLNEV